jgi:hypothetical protein
MIDLRVFNEVSATTAHHGQKQWMILTSVTVHTSGFSIDEFIGTACLRVIAIAQSSFLSCSAVNQREKRKKELKFNDAVFSLK